jgi:hypothetical protein
MNVTIFEAQTTTQQHGETFFLPQNIEFCVDKIKVRFHQLPTANKTKLAKKEKKKNFFLFSSGSHIENALTLLK